MSWVSVIDNVHHVAPPLDSPFARSLSSPWRQLLVIKEGFGYERSQEGPQAKCEMKCMHVGAAVSALPDVEDDHIAGSVHVAATKPGDEGHGVEGGQAGAVGVGSQGAAHRHHTAFT